MTKRREEKRDEKKMKENEKLRLRDPSNKEPGLQKCQVFRKGF